MSGSKKKSDSEKGSSSLADHMKNKEGDPRMPKLGSSNTRGTSGSSASGSGRSVSSSSSTVLESESAKNGLGEVETARSHLVFQGHRPDEVTSLKLKEVTKHMRRCTEARKRQDWCAMLKEAMEATTSGAVVSSQLFACQTEAHLKLRQINAAQSCLLKTWKYDPSAATYNKSKIFGFSSEAYICYVVALYNVALGQFDTARSAIEKASQHDPENAEVFALLEITSGIALFRAGRYKEACSVYDEAPPTDSMNSFLYCARAACWSKLGEWEKSLADSNQALSILPKNIKALSRRAMSNLKLERWEYAVIDYKSLCQKYPDDSDIADFLAYAQDELRKSRSEDKVELVSDLDKFKAVTKSDVAVILFKEISNEECSEMLSFVDSLSKKYYKSVKFLKVDVELSAAIALSEGISTVPTIMLYKNGSSETLLPSSATEVLDSVIKNSVLKRWSDAVRDFEILQEELPCDEEVAANLSHARVELHREAPDGKVELVSDVEKFQAVIASGESVVYFNEVSNPEYAWMSSLMDTLSAKYPSVIFLKVVVEQSRAAAENITTLPSFRLYKDGSRVGTATLDELEIMIKDNLIDPI